MNPAHEAAERVAALPSLQALSGKKLLLTGGTGFVGTWLLELIAAFNAQQTIRNRCHVYLPSRDPARFARHAPHLAACEEFNWLPGDLRTAALPTDGCDLVIHAAAPADPLSLRQNPGAVAAIIVEGSQRIIDWAVTHTVERLLFVSSGAVYGTMPADMPLIAETFTGGPVLDQPHSVYAEAKRYVEVLFAIARVHQQLPSLVARPFSFIGAYQSLEAGFAVTDFIRDGLRGLPLVVHNPAVVRSYAYGADLAVWLLTILLDGQIGRAYNVGSPEPITLLTLAEMVCRALADQQIQTEVQITPATDSQPRTGSRYVPDVSRAEQELHVQLHYSLEESIQRTIGWFIHRPQPDLTRG